MSNIPKPQVGRKLEYPFDTIEKNAPYTLDANLTDKQKISIVNSARQYGKRHKKKFSAIAKDGVTTIYRVK